MSDIRNFFAVKSKDQPKSKNGSSKNRPKPLISDSSDDDMFEDTPQRKIQTKTQPVKGNGQGNKKAVKRRLSDSSSEDLEKSSDDERKGNAKCAKNKPENGATKIKPSPLKNIATTEQSKPKSNILKPVDAKDFFSASTAKLKPLAATRKSPRKGNKKRKDECDNIEEHDDPSFMAMLLDMEDKTKNVQEQKITHRSNGVGKIVQPPSQKSPIKEFPNLIKETSLSSKLSKAKLQENGKNTEVKTEVQKSSIIDEKQTPEIFESLTSSSRLEPRNISSQASETLSQSSCSSVRGASQRSQVDDKIVSGNKPFQLWVDKYKPTTTKGIIGQQGEKSNMRKLQSWLKAWDRHHGKSASGKPPTRPPPWGASKDDGAWAKAALLSGPPGVGKTTTSYLVACELGYEIMEMNASDTRSKKKLDTEVSDALSSKSVSNTNAQRFVNRKIFLKNIPIKDEI